MQQVKEGVYRTYQSIMRSVCGEMLNNERILGRVVPDEDGGDLSQLNGGDWFKDPSEMSGYELFQAISKLACRIERQKKLIECAKEDLEILTLAKDHVNLDVGFKIVELIKEERGM
jgi:hypothetical protein